MSVLTAVSLKYVSSAYLPQVSTNGRSYSKSSAFLHTTDDTLLPQISYLTLVDYVVWFFMFIIFLVSVAHAAMSLVNKALSETEDGYSKTSNETATDYSWDMSTDAATVDYVLLVVTFLCWLSVTVWFAMKWKQWKRAENTSSASGQLRESRESTRRRSERRAARRFQPDVQEDASMTMLRDTSRTTSGQRSSSESSPL